MFALDLFNNDHERHLAEGAVDQLEQRRIDDLAMKMDDLVARAKKATTPEAKAALVREFQKCKAERDSYYKIREAGIPGNVPTEKIPGKEDLLKGKGRSYYEAQDQKKNSEVTESQRLSVGDPIIVTAPNEFEGKTGEVAEFSPSGKFVVVNLYNHGEHSMHLSDVEFNQYADDQDADEYGEYEDGLNEFAPSPERDDDEVPDQILTLANRWWNATDDQPKIANVLRSLGWSIAQVESEDDAVQLQHNDGTVVFISADDFDPDMFEGWSDAIVAQRTGRPRTPYSVYIKGKKWKDFENDDHAEAVANKLRAKFKADGRDPSVITIAPTDYDKGMAEAISKKDLLSKLAKDLNTPFKKAKSGELKSNSSDFTKGDHWTGPDKDDPSYTRNFGHGYPDTPSNRSHDRYVNKSLKKDIDEAGSPAQQAAIAIAKKKEQGVEEAIVASGPSKPLDDRAVRKLVWDTMKINADSGEQAIQRALSVLAKKPQSRMVQDLQDKFQSLADRLSQGIAEADDRVDPILIKALKRMPDGLTTHREVLDAAYDAYAMELGYLSMKGNYGVTDVYMPKLMSLYKQKHGLTFNEAETDYSKRRQREKDVDAGKPVARQREPRMTDYQKKRAQDKKDMALGEDQDTSGVESAIIRRIMVAHTDLLKQFGPQKVMQAAEEVAYNVGDVDEIGTSDVSAYVAQVRQILGA